MKKRDEDQVRNVSGDENEREIDLLELFHKLWNRKRLILYWTIAGALIGIIIAWSIPKEFATEVKLAPETTSNRTMSGGLGALASMAGISAGAMGGTDAVSPTLYPDVVKSVPFITSLFDIVVTTQDGEGMFTVRDFIDEETREPWWKAVMSLPGKAVGAAVKVVKQLPDDEEDPEHKIDNFQLTPDEQISVMKLSQRIKVDVDQKTNVITINVEMQDPLVSAVLADSVVARLQEYITNYRTNKSRKDLEYAELLNTEAQQQYYEAQQKLASYTDRNQNLATQSAKVNLERLENETSLAYDLYNQTAQQVQAAKAKVQETTPVYAILTPATVPMRPSRPHRGLIVAGCGFLGLAACCGWILVGAPAVDRYKQKRREEADNDDKNPD